MLLLGLVLGEEEGRTQLCTEVVLSTQAGEMMVKFWKLHFDKFNQDSRKLGGNKLR